MNTPRFSWRSWRLGGLLFLGFLIYASLLPVDATRHTLLTEFGRVVKVYRPEEAGLNLKWPWQAALTVDRRLRVFDPPAREALTGDKRNLEVAPYVAWKVADPEVFLRSAGGMEAAEARLAERVSAALGAAIGRRELKGFATTEESGWHLDAMLAEVRDEVTSAAREELGAEVVDVRLRRFVPPLEVRPAAFDLIRSERRQVAATLRAEGETKAREILSRAERDRDALLAAAEADAERLKGRGEAEATRILNAAHARDPQFYEFVRSLETYRSLLDDKATVVLSSSSPLLKLLTQGPPESLTKEPEAPATEARP